MRVKLLLRLTPNTPSPHVLLSMLKACNKDQADLLLIHGPTHHHWAGQYAVQHWAELKPLSVPYGSQRLLAYYYYKQCYTMIPSSSRTTI